MSKYITEAETAKLIRKALKEYFTGIKFSVTSHTATVDIAWEGGPSFAEVKGFAQQFTNTYNDEYGQYSDLKGLNGEEVLLAVNSIGCQRA